MAGRWLDVQQAAYELGLSTDAVRKRISRGSLVSEERDGRRVVWLDSSGTATGHGGTEESEGDRELVDTLRTQVDDLREQVRAEREANRENRRLLAAALERIPELESGERSEDRPHEAATEEPDPDPGPTSGKPQQAPRRSWWRRLFEE